MTVKGKSIAHESVVIRPVVSENTQGIVEKPMHIDAKKMPLSKPIRVRETKPEASNITEVLLQPRETEAVTVAAHEATNEIMVEDVAPRIEHTTPALPAIEAPQAIETSQAPEAEAVDRAIKDILEFEPKTYLPEAATQEGVSGSVYLLAESLSETPEQNEAEHKNIFVELREYVATLEAVEPAKAEHVHPLVEEAVQIAEALAELRGLRDVDVVAKSEVELAEEQSQMEQIEARLEAVCVKILESLEVEPTAERVRLLVQELLEAAQTEALEQLSIEQLAKRGTHEYKLPGWFQSFIDRPQDTVRAIGQLVIAKYKNSPATG